MHAVDAEHVRDLVRIRHDGGRPQREHESRELVHHELHRLEVHVRVDEPGDDVAPGRVERLAALVASDPCDDPVDDCDVRLQPLAREDRQDASAPHDEVSGLVPAGDCETALQLLHRGQSNAHRGCRIVAGSGQVGQEEQMRKKFVVGGLVLALAADRARACGRRARRGPSRSPFKVAFIYPGPARRRWLVAGARRGPPRDREGAREQGRDDLQGERLLERRRCRRSSPALSARATP